jgi:hypothetical protein
MKSPPSLFFIIKSLTARKIYTKHNKILHSYKTANRKSPLPQVMETAIGS